MTEDEIPEDWKTMSMDAKLFKVLRTSQVFTKDVEKLVDRVQQHDHDIEMVRKQLVRNTVRIRNLEEDENESPMKTIEKVESLLAKIGFPKIDYDDIFRIGKFTPRPIILKMLRRRDKTAVLVAKKNLKNFPETKNVFISSELTKREAEVEKQLRDTAKIWKQTDPALKFFIGNGTLLVESNGKKTRHGLNDEGAVEERK